MERSFSLADFANFEKLIAPKVLKVVYWVGLVGIALGFLVMLVSAFGVMQYSFATGLGTLLLSIFGCAFAILMWRVVIEMYTVFFGIYERLGDIRDDLKKP